MEKRISSNVGICLENAAESYKIDYDLSMFWMKMAIKILEENEHAIEKEREKEKEDKRKKKV